MAPTSGDNPSGADWQTAAPEEVSEELVTALRALRKRLAAGRSVPAYVIFSDATLLDIAAIRPRSAEALLAISGIGPKKLELYGAAVLETVSRAAPTA